MDEEKLEGLLERGVSALERLSEDPVIQMETGPPVCPHCERINPVVRVEEGTATGMLAEFLIQALCQHCNKIFYALPLQWATVKNPSEAKQVITERAELSGNNGR